MKTCSKVQKQKLWAVAAVMCARQEPGKPTALPTVTGPGLWKEHPWQCSQTHRAPRCKQHRTLALSCGSIKSPKQHSFPSDSLL